MTKLNGNALKRIKESEIVIAEESNITIYNYPLFGPNDYQMIMQQIGAGRLLRPTSGQLISLLDVVLQNEDDSWCQNIIDKFKNEYLWTCTEHITLPNEGIIIYDNINGMNPDTDLRKRCVTDNNFRFVPFGFKTEYQGLDDYLNNPYVIKHFGENHMGAVERVARRLKSNPYVSALLESQTPERRFCALLQDKKTLGLALHGKGSGTGKEGYSLGIKE